jgi:DNA-directed RNA polymerase specialized sigma24 family protein
MLLIWMSLMSASIQPADAVCAFVGEIQCACRFRRFSTELTEEIVQCAALLALEGRVSARVRNFRWLDTFVRRMAARVLSTESSGSSLIEEFPDPLGARSKRSPDEMVQSILARLPTRMRRALELCYLNTEPIPGCARALGLTEPAIRQLCHRAILEARACAPEFLSHS